MQTRRMDLKKSLTRVGVVTMGILLVPALGMVFTTDWDWSSSDFVIFGFLVALIGSLIEWVNFQVLKPQHRLLLMGGLILLGIYIWAELAVGIFTNLGN